MADFLQAVLDLPAEEYQRVVIVDPHLNPEDEGDKQGILDVKIHTASGKVINVEIQVEPYAAMRERILFYASRMLHEQIGSGDEYRLIRKVVSIVITDWPLVRENHSYHNRYRLHDEQTGSCLTDLLEIHILELPKLPREADDSQLWNWLRFFNARTEGEFAMLSKENPAIAKAVAVLKEFSEDEKMRWKAEMREKARRDQVARTEYLVQESMVKGLEKGLEQGLEEGLEKGREEATREVALKALRAGLSREVILALTGLNPEKLDALAAEIHTP